MTSSFNGITRLLEGQLSRYLSQTSQSSNGTAVPTDLVRLMACLQPGDVLLVEGQTRVSTAIKYLTQSTWSHAALFVDTATGLVDAQGRPRAFVEADIREGVRAVSVDEFAGLHCRVCRPVGLSPSEIAAMIFYSPPQFGQCAVSISNTRFSSLAQLSRTGRWCAQVASHSAGGAACAGGSGFCGTTCGTTCARSLALGARTPWKRIRCSLGLGTSAASRCMISSGDITRCVVPSRQGVLSLSTT